MALYWPYRGDRDFKYERTDPYLPSNILDPQIYLLVSTIIPRKFRGRNTKLVAATRLNMHTFARIFSFFFHSIIISRFIIRQQTGHRRNPILYLYNPVSARRYCLVY